MRNEPRFPGRAAAAGACWAGRERWRCCPPANPERPLPHPLSLRPPVDPAVPPRTELRAHDPGGHHRRADHRAQRRGRAATHPHHRRLVHRAPPVRRGRSGWRRLAARPARRRHHRRGEIHDEGGRRHAGVGHQPRHHRAAGRGCGAALHPHRARIRSAHGPARLAQQVRVRRIARRLEVPAGLRRRPCLSRDLEIVRMSRPTPENIVEQFRSVIDGAGRRPAPGSSRARTART